MSVAGEKRSYKDTLNLPRTAFPMKANLVGNEPASLERWDALGVYARLREARAGGAREVFHDGPPYANGSIHLGHLMNKCLKDFVVRSRGMMGRDCPFVPGWDCHGLPIEHKVMTAMVSSGEASGLADMAPDRARMTVREACQRYAEENVALQSGQMRRLLTLADYGDPYLTMKPAYEGAVLEVLATLVERGIVYRALKPVHWSIANETALADAELEYMDREDLSVYVDFVAADADAVYDAFGLPPRDPDAEEDRRPALTPSFMIWTTTPWTLPANLAIAAHPEITYALARIDGNVTVLAQGAIERVTTLAESEDIEVLATAPGSALAGLKYRHPFIEVPHSPPAGGEHAGSLARAWSVVLADYVTLEDGTGLVHTAPGHGTEDYQTGLREGLPVYCPVLGNGCYDETTPEWLRGQHIWKANEAITEHLRQSGHLFHGHRFNHSYPHDWRSKTPVIFRCTEQWFVSVDKPFGGEGASLRERALGFVDPDAPVIGPAGAGKVRFMPEWGRNRMRGMLESRPDWCISRQRSWGLPIPAFALPSGEVFMTAASARAIAARFREAGSDAWFTERPAELLRHYDAGADADAPASLREGSVPLDELTRGGDILDVWFESGSSWNAVMRERLGEPGFPVSTYLEGSDQHRGWFQLSMLPSIGVTGRPPFDALFTHGFCVDKEGKKLSKSAGHTIEALFDKYGADVMRWWVASAPYEGDVKVDDEFFKLAGEAYRKIRNTLRFMLGTLAGFDPAAGRVPAGEIPPTAIEAWALAAYDRAAGTVIEGYERYDFRAAHAALYEFCNHSMSAVYLAATKDRLYCDDAASPRRLRTLTAMHDLCDGLCRLIAPILPHTADEAWREMPGRREDDCVHLETFVRGFGVEADAGWPRVMEARAEALKALEDAKAGMGLDNPLDAGLVFADPDGTLARFDPVDLADLCGVSRASLGGGSGVVVQDLREEPRCERSRKRDGTVRPRSDGGLLSDRDAAAIGV